MKSSQDISHMRSALLNWYDQEGRALPWRIRPEDRRAGAKPEPYAVWLSEIMCQQTTTRAVIPYWEKFLALWPRIEDLARVPREDVLTAWAGLGYYARARNLHKCAQYVVEHLDGCFPCSEAELLKLPGIGPYTAAAIAAICWQAPTNVVDGNVERVISRLHALETPLPKAKPEIKELAGALACPSRPADYAQAIMDLGAVICRPKSPQCTACPWAFACKARAADNPVLYPKRQAKQKRPVKYGAVFYLENQGHIYLRTRPDKGLLGAMAELPGTPWQNTPLPVSDALAFAPSRRNWQKARDSVRHIFTHFELYLDVFCAHGQAESTDGFWVALDKRDTAPLPSVMSKAITIGQATLGSG